MGRTSIEWTEETWNPVRGCRKISPGCKHCYAAVFAERFRGVAGHPYERGFDPRFVPGALNAPTGWRAPRRVFVNSMSDLFLEDFSNEQIAAVFGVMAQTPRHTYQVLTKRARRMREWFEWVVSFEREHGPPADEVVTVMAENFGADIDHIARQWPLPNVWIGVSVEDQKRADERIPEILKVPARVRFLSCEPLLESVRIDDIWYEGATLKPLVGLRWVPEPGKGLVLRPASVGPKIDWVIVGGESGPGARSFDLAWARSIRDQCAAASTACFIKQMGSQPIWNPEGEQWWKGPHTNGNGSPRFADSKGGDWSEWPKDLRVRQWPEVRT